MDVNIFAIDLLTILVAGLVAGAICKRIGLSLLVGYLVVGALVGRGAFDLVAQENHELEYLARAGALLLLFSVGIEFSVEELVRMSRFFLIGGVAQMSLVAVPLAATCWAFGMTPNTAILAGLAAALSSTVLVFKALAEWGQTATPHGRRAIGILLFQDVALVPLMLLVPLLTQTGDSPTVVTYGLLALKSLFFIVAVVVLRRLIGHSVVPQLTQLRSVELVVLFALSVLGGMCWGASRLGLPPAIGALAAGMMLSGNRLSKQVDTIILPFRETFAAVFFVTLGTLFNPRVFMQEPLLLTAGLIGILLLKSTAAAVALKIIGLNWKAALGMGLGLAQLGEFSFLILAEGLGRGIFTSENHSRMLFVAMGTLILTPQLLKLGLRWTGGMSDENAAAIPSQLDHRPIQHGAADRRRTDRATGRLPSGNHGSQCLHDRPEPHQLISVRAAGLSNGRRGCPRPGSAAKSSCGRLSVGRHQCSRRSDGQAHRVDVAGNESEGVDCRSLPLRKQY